MRYFEALGIPPRLSINLADLEQRFYARSRELHPDRFARASRDDQQRALQSSSELNDAYRTLRNPISRAEYFLEEKGMPSGQLPPDVLEDFFDLSMDVEGGDPEAKARVRSMLDELDRELSDRSEALDLPGVRLLLDRRRYLTNLLV